MKEGAEIGAVFGFGLGLFDGSVLCCFEGNEVTGLRVVGIGGEAELY